MHLQWLQYCPIGARCENLDRPTNDRVRRLERVHKWAQITYFDGSETTRQGAGKNALALLQFVTSWDAGEAELGPG